MHYVKLIDRFDKPHTFFYIDPPYFKCEDDYGKGIFGREDFARLRDILREVKGKFIMSINDAPEIRELYKNFHIEEVTTTYNSAKKMGVTELLVMNYKPSEKTSV